MIPTLCCLFPDPCQTSSSISHFFLGQKPLRSPRLMCEISECGVRAHDGATEVSLNKRLFQRLDAQIHGKPSNLQQKPSKIHEISSKLVLSKVKTSEGQREGCGI